MMFGETVAIVLKKYHDINLKISPKSLQNVKWNDHIKHKNGVGRRAFFTCTRFFNFQVSVLRKQFHMRNIFCKFKTRRVVSTKRWEIFVKTILVVYLLNLSKAGVNSSCENILLGSVARITHGLLLTDGEIDRMINGLGRPQYPYGMWDQWLRPEGQSIEQTRVGLLPTSEISSPIKLNAWELRSLHKHLIHLHTNVKLLHTFRHVQSSLTIHMDKWKHQE